MVCFYHQILARGLCYPILITTVLAPSPLWQPFCQKRSQPMVTTELGQIVGEAIDFNGIGVNRFLGVPFAEPPLGDLRFRKPESVRPWNSPLMATSQPPACIQHNLNPFPWYDNQPGKSEDCLYLNIWVPSSSRPNHRKAVIFWIFGGGFFMGSIRSDAFQAEALAAVGDVVVVTVSYRLASFGFLYFNTTEAPGNSGVYDILEGLRWVNKNIEAFGGDRSRITISGESAGSIVTGLLAVSPLARGLYRRMIMQSASPAYTIADDMASKNMDRSRQLAIKVGCVDENVTFVQELNDVMKCMRELDAQTLIEAEVSMIPGATRSSLPQYGNEMFPVNARQAVIDKSFQNSGELLVGVTHDEGSFQVTSTYREIFGFSGEKNPSINKTIGEQLLRRTFSNYPNLESLVKHYLGNVQEDKYSKVRYQLYTASGDFTLLCPTVYFAEKYAEKGNNVYFYFYNHRPRKSPWSSWMGSVHYDEVQFVFGAPLRRPSEYTPEEINLSVDLIMKWSTFAKTGKPSATWPLYSIDNPVYVEINSKLSNEKGFGPHRSNCDFFRSHFGFD